MGIPLAGILARGLRSEDSGSVLVRVEQASEVGGRAPSESSSCWAEAPLEPFLRRSVKWVLGQIVVVGSGGRSGPFGTESD